ncbi:MAG: hypothetical protein WBZ36_15515 [Candidatus Nitrosopolaris sp.]
MASIVKHSLDLKKELFNLNEMLLNVIGDYNRVSKEHQDTTNLSLQVLKKVSSSKQTRAGLVR